MKLFKITFFSLLVSLLPGAAEASITITSNATWASASTAMGFPSNSALFTGTLIPTSTTLNAIDSPNYSNNSIEWSSMAGQTALSIGMDHKRSGTQGSYAQTQNSQGVSFTANFNASYELSGNYQVTDVVSNTGGRVYHFASLWDDTVSSFLFFNYQESRATHDEHFTLMETGGDFGNDLFGNLTGNLTAGHSYKLFFNSFIQAWPDADSGASAIGNLTLTIGDIAAVPELSSFMVWACLVAGVVFLRPSRWIKGQRNPNAPRAFRSLR